VISYVIVVEVIETTLMFLIVLEELLEAKLLLELSLKLTVLVSFFSLDFSSFALE